MTRSLAWTWVQDAVTQATALAPGALCYGFGSFFRGEEAYADIDLLVVCRDSVEAMRLREGLAPLCRSVPLDVLIMEAVEADMTDFVAGQECQPLSDAD